MSNETLIAEKIANYVLSQPSNDPDSDICILARQFLRKCEFVRTLVYAAGGHVFIPDMMPLDANSDKLMLTVCRNEKDGGCDVTLRQPFMSDVDVSF